MHADLVSAHFHLRNRLDLAAAEVTHEELIRQLECFGFWVRWHTVSATLSRLRSSVASRNRPVINLSGLQVLRLRTERDWSQEQLAARCQRVGWDVSRDIIARIEAGIRAVTDRDLAFLAQVFDVSLRELYPTSLRAKLR